MSSSRYIFNNEDFEKLTASLLYISTSKYENDWQSIPHIHHFSELIYITEGRGFFALEGKKYQVSEGDLIIIPPDMEHTELSFDYTEFEPLEYTENTLNSILIATVVFYIYTILGLDFDSFSPKGGTAFLGQAMQIVSLAQAQPTWTGWKAFENDRNRHALATALTDNTSELFRDMWYNYHRKGLDEMAANPDRGRTTIIGLLPVLEQVKSARPTSPLLQMFADSKLDEVVLIYSKATTPEKQEGYKMLSNLYPALTTRMESLKK